MQISKDQKPLQEYEKAHLEKLGMRIKALRIQKGYTSYEQFSYEHGISRAQWGRYEKGGNMTFTTLIRILKALDTDIETFFREQF